MYSRCTGQLRCKSIEDLSICVQGYGFIKCKSQGKKCQTWTKLQRIDVTTNSLKRNPQAGSNSPMAWCQVRYRFWKLGCTFPVHLSPCSPVGTAASLPSPPMVKKQSKNNNPTNQKRAQRKEQQQQKKQPENILSGDVLSSTIFCGSNLPFTHDYFTKSK